LQGAQQDRPLSQRVFLCGLSAAKFRTKKFNCFPIIIPTRRSTGNKYFLFIKQERYEKVPYLLPLAIRHVEPAHFLEVINLSRETSRIMRLQKVKTYTLRNQTLPETEQSLKFTAREPETPLSPKKNQLNIV